LWNPLANPCRVAANQVALANRAGVIATAAGARKSWLTTKTKTSGLGPIVDDDEAQREQYAHGISRCVPLLR
jgi:hypothetical protein